VKLWSHADVLIVFFLWFTGQELHKPKLCRVSALSSSPLSASRIWSTSKGLAFAPWWDRTACFTTLTLFVFPGCILRLAAAIHYTGLVRITAGVLFHVLLLVFRGF